MEEFVSMLACRLMLHYEQVEYSNAEPEGLVLELFFTVTKDANSSNSDKREDEAYM